MEDTEGDWTQRTKEGTKFTTVPCPYIEFSMTLSRIRNQEMKKSGKGNSVWLQKTSKKTPRELKLEAI